MKLKLNLILITFLFFGFNLFSVNTTYFKLAEEMSVNKLFEPTDCPSDVTNNTILASFTTICSGETVTFTGSIPEIIPNQDSTFQWQSDASGTWQDLSGETAKDFASGVLTETTTFRRVVRFLDCSTDFISNEIQITVETVSAPSGEQNQSFCSSDNPLVSSLIVSGTNLSWYNDEEETVSISTNTPLINGTTYYATQQNENNCESSTLAVTAEVSASPTLSITSSTDPTTCGGNGTIIFSFTGVSNGTYNIDYDTGSFANVSVNNGSATVYTDAGTYSNLKIIANGCPSSDGISTTLTDPNPPSEPSVSVSNECGKSILTASNYTGSLLWSTGQIIPSITVTEVGEYTVTQTLNGCISDPATANAAPLASPTLSITSSTDPTTCGGNGTIVFSFTGVDNGTYDIDYDTGTFTGVYVDGGSATVYPSAGTYFNITISINGCPSADGISTSLSDPNPPSEPSVSVSNECGKSVLTASNYTGSLLWSTGQIIPSITVTEAGEYTVTQTLNGCISNPATANAAPLASPTLSITSSTDPTTCGGNGTIIFSFTGVSNGTYNIDYDTGSFANVSVNNGSATVYTDAGTYSNLKIIANGCPSSDGISTTLTDPNPPSEPSVSVSNECGKSILTASNYTGSLLWSTGQIIPSITVTEVGEYTVTQTLNGCISDPATANAAPLASPTLSITSSTDPTTCGGNGTIVFSFTGVDNGTYDIDYDTGTFTGVYVDGGSATVYPSAGTYSNITISANGCPSSDGISTTLTDPNPPSEPSVSVFDSCGVSILTAYDYTGSLLWSTGETTSTIRVTEAAEYYVTQTVNNCTSNPATANAIPVSIPTLSITSATNPATCEETGSIVFSFTDVPDGTYNIYYDAGNFNDVSVNNGSATVYTDAGTYSNLKIIANECPSTDGISSTLSDPNPPSEPSVSVSNECGKSVLTASNYTGTLLWSTGQIIPSITVTEAGEYTVTQTLNGCISDPATIVASPKAIPTLSITSSTDPTTCGGNGTIVFSFTGVDNGTYDIDFDTGTFTGVYVDGGSATVYPSAGTYSNITISVNGCPSTDGISTSLTDPNPPSEPSVSVSNECGKSVLTASNYTGSLLWSTGQIIPSITVTEAGEYTVTQTLNGCISNPATANAAPLASPTLSITSSTDPTTCGGNGTIIFSFTGVSNGTYNIDYDTGSFANVSVNNGSATVYTDAGTYSNLKIIANGCPSSDGISTTLTDPNPPSEPSVSVSNECGKSILTASNYTGSLLWSTGQIIPSITVTEVGEYTVTQTLNGCISDPATANAAPLASPTLSITSSTDPTTCGGNGTIVFSFTGVDNGTYDIDYDTGTFTGVYVDGGSATVYPSAGTYFNITISINGCPSADGISTSLSDPNPPSEPSVSVSNECGKSVLTASNYTGSLLWSTGQIIPSITVTEAGEYTVTQTLNGCISNPATIVATPKAIPTLSITSATNPTTCSGNGTIIFSFTGVSNGTYNIDYDTGSFANVSVNNGSATVYTDAGTYSNLKIIANGCPSSDGISTTLTDPNPPSEPSVSVSNECGKSVLTASNYTGSLLWSTGQIIPSITVTEVGEYTVTQTLNGCISDPATIVATPKAIPTLSITSATNPTTCSGNGTIIFSFTGVSNGTYNIDYDTGSFANVSVNNGSATVYTDAGTYSNLKIIANGCPSSDGISTTLTDPNPPSEPSVSVSNECGKSVLTASNYTGSLLWSTGQIIPSITVTEVGEYTVTQTLNGCISDPATIVATPKVIPTLSITSATDPLTCDGLGSIVFSFTDVPDGSYNIYYDEGSFTNVSVSEGSATVYPGAGTYSNITISVNGCTSAEVVSTTLTDPNPPSEPTVSVFDSCGVSILTAYDYTGSLLWSTGETTSTIRVTEAAEYYVTQTVNNCTSNPATANAIPVSIPTLSITSATNPATCEGTGSIVFSLTDVPDGTYNIYYDAGNFNDVSVNNGSATVYPQSGTYNNLKINANECTSINGINVALNDPNAPGAPLVSVNDSCGITILTAFDYDPNAMLEWSTGDTGKTIIATEAKSYSVIQKLNGCISVATTIMANPKIIPSAPDFSVLNNCNGTSTLTAVKFNSNAQLEWSTYESSNVITVTKSDTYSLKQILDGCVSEIVSKIAKPKISPTLQVFISNPLICGSQGTLGFTFTNVPNGTHSILYDGGSFENVSVLNNNASVSAFAGTYNNLIIFVDSCSSANGINATLSNPDAPKMPNIIVDNRCGKSILTATGIEQNANIEWNTGDTTQFITVIKAGQYSVTQTINGCISDVKTANANPKTVPDKPDFTVIDNCNGTSILKATDYNYQATLLWSTGEFKESISVTEPGNYSLSQILNGCQSDLVTKEANPKTAPSLHVEVSNPEKCGGDGIIDFTFTNVPDEIYSITYDHGIFSNIPITNNCASVKAGVGTYNNLIITIDECSSEIGVNAVLSDPLAPEPPILSVNNRCTESEITVTNYNPAATLHWNTGDSTEVITVTNAGTYLVSQQLNGCTSNAAQAVAKPKINSGIPEVEIIDNCGESVINMKNLPEDTWFVWQFNEKTDSTKNNTITVNEPGDYTVFERIEECTGEDTTLTANPLYVPQSPITLGDKLICRDDSLDILIAEAVLIDTNSVLIWYNMETGGNEVLSPILDSLGTITYYAESKNIENGCKSIIRTPVNLTMLQSAKSLILDSTLIGKPKQNVAVLIFPENLTGYQWYLNNTEISGETKQYLYIPESQRKNENLFSVEVRISNGCKATYNYSYSELSGNAFNNDNSFDILNPFSFKLFPNPADKKLSILIDDPTILNEQDLYLKIYSINGTCVAEMQLKSPYEMIDTYKLNPGIYSVILYAERDFFRAEKLIISH